MSDAHLARYFVLALTCLALVALATPARSASSSSKTNATAARYSLGPFDQTLNSLPRTFQGNDAATIFNVLSGKKFQKDEFESVDSFANRLPPDTKVLGQLELGSLYAFSMFDTDLMFSYDAENALAEVKGVLLYAGIANRSLLRGLVWRRSSHDLGSYVGANAFNRQVLVHKAKQTFFVIAIASSPPPFDKSTELFEVKLPMSAEVARDAKHNLALLIVGRPASPFAYEDEKYHEPTISDPSDYVTRNKVLPLNVEEVWFYNRRSGVVYKSFSR